MRAEDRWADGTLDVINVETLQQLSWLKTHNIEVGGTSPIPLDLAEMGLREDLTATVLDIAPCPEIKEGTGRVVLTTVNHLNRDIVELTLRDAKGNEETLRPTGTHKFYSVNRNQWLSASQLENGEQLDGTNSLITVVGLKQIPGTHRVYNMTVQGEHLYRVARCGVLVHNMKCGPELSDLARQLGISKRKAKATIDEVKRILGSKKFQEVRKAMAEGRNADFVIEGKLSTRRGMGEERNTQRTIYVLP